ncbi:hypothetical protein [uncultured Friedmanniella sp.]|uniref:hypothetical protein n=1 Tax=uncultured Friedmanniella sp. TaxID=335381 RepID=UPI0035C9E346
MDESSIIDQLRAGGDGLGTQDSDVDALVQGAVVRGRRRRTRRRAGAALGAVVAAAVVVTVVATGVVPTRLGSPQPGPVASPVVATPSPVSTGSPSVTASPSPPASPTTTGRLSGTPAQVEVAIADLLPSSFTVTRSVSDDPTSADGRELDAYLTLRDAKGTSNLIAGVSRGRYGDVCATNDPCTKRPVPGGGTLWLVGGGRDPDKAGDDGSAFYDRPDGGQVWLTQSNYGDGSGPVTRPGLPLTAAELRSIATSPTWDRFFRG